MTLASRKETTLARSAGIHRAQPLYQRAPRAGEDGRPLSDFMMFIPKLREKPQRLVQETILRIEQVLARYGDLVVFADLNLHINVLWVIVRPRPGACMDIPVAINDAVPEALLVAQPRFY